MNNEIQMGKEQFWKCIDDVKARALVTSIIGAAKAQVAYSQSLNATRRAEILLGESAGQEYWLRCQLQYRARNSQLKYTKQAFENLLKTVDENQKKRFEDFFKLKSYKDFIDYNRQNTILRLLNADTKPEDSKAALKQLDNTLEKIKTLNSLDEINSYLQHHLDELINKKIGNPDPNPWCVILLILSSLYIVLLLIAAIICALSFGFLCEDIFDQLITQVCGG